MRDLSAHILDIVENCIRAEATVVSVSIEENSDRDLMQIMIEDNGPGLSVPAEEALNPFYTTKKEKRVGLGLSLLQSTVERAEGELLLAKSSLGGLAVIARMKLNHVDRCPLGDIASTLSSIVCTNPGLDLTCRLNDGKHDFVLRVSDVVRELSADEVCGLRVARRVSEKIRYALGTLQLTE